MTKEQFVELMNICLEQYNLDSNKSKELEKFCGEDSNIILTTPMIDKTLEFIIKEMNDESEWVEWLFYENMVHNCTSKFYVCDIEYDGTPENVWEHLKGNLENTWKLNSENKITKISYLLKEYVQNNLLERKEVLVGGLSITLMNLTANGIIYDYKVNMNENVITVDVQLYPGTYSYTITLGIK